MVEKGIVQITLENPADAGKKCGGPGDNHRVFFAKQSDANESFCSSKCVEMDNCLAWSGQMGIWCIGCDVPLAANHPGAVAFTKQEDSSAVQMQAAGGKGDLKTRTDNSADGECLGPDDLQLIDANKEEAFDDIEGCVRSCASGGEAHPCLVTCLKDKVPLSTDCVGCFADLVTCGRINCEDSCVDDDEAACDACSQTACFGSLEIGRSVV